MFSNYTDDILKLPTQAYWSDFGGTEVKQICYEPEGEYVLCVSSAWYGNKICHKLKIHTTHSKDSRTYISMRGHRLYLDECVRTR